MANTKQTSRSTKWLLQAPTDDVVEQPDRRVTFVRFRPVHGEESLAAEQHQLPQPGTGLAPRWRWYHGVAFYLLVQGTGYILGNLVSTARRTPRQSPALWQQYFHELNQAAFAPPASLFVPVWAVNNVSAIWGLLRVLNRPAGAPGRTTFLRLQALSWLDLVVWNARRVRKRHVRHCTATQRVDNSRATHHLRCHVARSDHPSLRQPME